MARTTSKEAYDRIVANGLLHRSSMEIYGWLFANGPATARQIHTHIGTIRDIGCVTSVLAKMLRKDVVQKVGTSICQTTRQLVTVWDVTDRMPLKVERVQHDECPLCGGTGYLKPKG